ncbi:MAG TPA: radical SAM protein [Candidatus Binataceae bacterium]|nr:radical SAM protein [Candidatus Binataceae bacterium]
MSAASRLRVVLINPSKYAADGSVERFRRGFMPNSTLPHLASMTPGELGGATIDLHTIDEYVETDLDYLRLLESDARQPTLVAMVGVQSHQFHRALDLAAYARANGVEHVVIGGPHAMTCDTSDAQGQGVSFALAEAELIWPRILHDAIDGELQSLYGADQRWPDILDPPPLVPPPERNLRRYAVQMLGLYPARGCPYRCSFCSVIKIAGRQIRSQPVETTMATLRAAKAAGILLVMFTTDNFNKYPDAETLLQTMIDERLDLPFFVQCDAQVVRQPAFVELLGRAGCYQMFVGVESFDRATLLAAKKNQNHPERYRELVRLCRANGIGSHFSNIVGFPGDSDATIRDQLRTLRDLRPDVASFYLLTPIPGTEQYDDFLAQGLIHERNLDRFDGTCATWRHPNLSDSQLVDLLFRCYREFYSLPDALTKSARWFWDKRRSPNILLKIATAAYSFLSRIAAAQRVHPMAGGIHRVRLDGASDYRALRRERYGFDLAALPRSLSSSVATYDGSLVVRPSAYAGAAT